MDQTFILTALVLLLTTLILLGYLYFPRNLDSSKGDGKNFILLVGPSSSGKTALFCKWCFNFVPETVPSEAESVKPCALDDTKMIVDIPGSPAFKKIIDSHLKNTHAVVFVLDSTSQKFTENMKFAAQLLYDVLLNDEVQKRKTRIIVACNKQDELLAFKPNKMQAILELEMENVRKTATVIQTEKIGKASSMREEDNFLGVEGKRFSFEDMENEVIFVPSSVTAENGLKELENLLFKS